MRKKNEPNRPLVSSSKPSVYEALEPRILLDAAALATIAESTDTADTSAAAHANSNAESANPISENNQNPAAIDDPLSDESHQESSRKELIFIDSDVADSDTLLQDLFGEDIRQNNQYEIFEVSNSDNGIDMISGALSEHQDIDAIHILSHASTGTLNLGDATLTSENLNLHQADFQNWQQSLSLDADILLYGCRIAEGAIGVDFVDTFSELTGTDVAASTDNTGSQERGGNYALEYQSGIIETSYNLSGSSQWEGVLPSGPISDITFTDPEPFINETIEVTVSFDNTGDDTGYGPYIDLIIPPEVSNVGAGSLLSAGDTPLNEVGVWDAVDGRWEDGAGDEILVHPLNDDITLIDGDALGLVGGETWFYFEAPFGSFVPDQPRLDFTFIGDITTANGAEPFVATNQFISIAGFQFGDTPVDTDAPTVQAAPTVTTATPKLWEFEKTVDPGEAEAASGPNNPITYTLTLNVATGLTVDDVVITDMIPEEIYYIDGSITLVQGAGTITAPLEGSQANNTFSIDVGTLTGIAGDDIVIEYLGFVPDKTITTDLVADNDTGTTGSGASVIDLVAGGNTAILNDAQVDATYLGNAVTDNGPNSDAIFTAKSLAIQKGAAISTDNLAQGLTPTDVVTFTLDFQVSDYFEYNHLEIVDVLGDGWDYNEGSIEFSITEHNQNIGLTAVNDADITIVENAVNGETTLTFDLSQLMIDAGEDGILTGDLFNGDAFDGIATTGTITYTATVKEAYVEAPIPGDNPDPNQNIDLGDILVNNVTIEGTVRDADGDTVNVNQDDSGVSLQVVDLGATKTIYAVNGETDYGSASIQPNENITYRLQINLPSEDFENLVIQDFLPLPVFDLNDQAITFNNTPADNAAPPPAGEAYFGPNHSLTPTVTPIITQDLANNILAFDFGDRSVADSGAVVIDIIFTVTASDTVFAPGLQTSNQISVAHDSTSANQSLISEIVQVTLDDPELTITKGVVSVSSDVTGEVYSPATTGPAGVSFADANTPGAPFTGTINSAGLQANPIDSDVSNLDAGDVVRFAIVVENTSTAQAYDLEITDTLPAGFSNETMIGVFQGDGTEIANTEYSGDIFDAGDPLTFVDPGDTVGILQASDTAGNDGSNIIVIIVEATVNAGQEVATDLSNMAQIVNFTTVNDTVNNAAPNLANPGNEPDSNPNHQDNADVTITSPTITKTLTGTSITGNGNALLNEATIGERVTYTLVITIPEGEIPDMTVVDTLDLGLSLSSIISITPSAGITSDDASAFDPLSNGSAVGQNINFDFGTITNSENDNNDVETITIVYETRVENIIGNQSSDPLNNSAQVFWNNGNNNTSASSANNITVVEPVLQVVGGYTPVGGDALDNITYQTTISHAGNSDTDAFDLNISIPFKEGISFDITDVTVTHSVDGNITAQFEVVSDGSGGFVLQLQAGEDVDLLLTENIIITINQTINADVDAGAVIDANASVTWTSLDDQNIVDNTAEDLAEERDGSDGEGNVLNNYAATDVDVFTVNKVVTTKTVTESSIDNGADNDLLDVVIGEIITYEVTLTVPEGEVNGAKLVDTLDLGLEFIALDSVVFSSADISSTLQNDSVINDGINNAQVITIDLGVITNNNSANGTLETITFTYRAKVLNQAFNNSGDRLNNSAELQWTATNGDNSTSNQTSGPASAPEVIIIEPELEVVKNVVSGNDVGDSVTYNIIIGHSGDSETGAYDVNFSDNVPAELNISSFTVTHSDLGDISGRFDLTDNLLTTDVVFDLDLGQTVTIVINANIAENTQTGIEIDNTANIGWTSLDAGNPNDGDDTQERDSATGYSDNDNALFVLSKAKITKSLISTSITDAFNDNTEAVIGETAVYEVIITFPEGVTNASELIDTLDPGLEFVSLDSIIASGGITSSNGDFGTIGNFPIATANTPATGEEISIDLGNITNADNDADAETLTLRYTVLVKNISESNNNDVKDNSAVIAWNNGSDDASAPADAEDITVIEPVLVANKVIDDGTPELNQTVQYTITIQNLAANGSQANAFDLIVRDTIPDNMTLDLGSINVVGGVIDGNTSAGNTINLVLDTISLGSTITITYEATVDSAPADITNLINDGLTSQADNQVILQWTSIDGVNAEERSGNGAVVNDYETTALAEADIVNPDLEISKSGVTPMAVPGGFIEYVLTATNNGTADATQVVVTDDFPDIGDAPNDASLTLVSSTPSVGSIANVGGVITWMVGNLAQGDSETLTLRFSVSDNADVGNVITNEAVINSNKPTYVEPDPSDNSNTEQSAVAEPTLSKSLIGTSINSANNANNEAVIGELVTYELVITLPEAEIPLVEITDMLDLGLGFVSLDSITTNATSMTTSIGNGVFDATNLANFNPTLTNNGSTAAQILSFDLGNILNGDTDVGGETITLRYTVQVLDIASNTEGQTRDNSAQLEWSASDLTTDIFDAEDINIREPVLNVDKEMIEINGNAVPVDPAPIPELGDVVTYQVVLTNPVNSDFPNQGTDAFDISFIDNIPANMTLDLGSINVIGATIEANTSAGNAISLTFDRLDQGDGNTITVTYSATVNSDAIAAQNLVDNGYELAADNIVNISWTSLDGEIAGERDGDDYNDSDTEQALIRNPDLSITKASNTNQTVAGGFIDYTFTVSNNGSSTATDVEVSDDYPPSLTFISATPAAGVSDNGGDFVWTIASLDAGDSQTITVRFQVADNVVDGVTINNSADVTSTTAGYVEPTPADNTNDDDTLVVSPSVSKSLQSTGINDLTNDNTEAVIGETLTYRVVMTIPEADMENVVLVDVMDIGLEFVSISSISNNAGVGNLTTDIGDGTFNNTNVNNFTPGLLGQTLSFDLGDIVNNNNTAADETITIEYVVRVVNENGNQSGTLLNNEAKLTWDGNGGATNETAADSSDNITVIEPELAISKSVNAVSDANDAVEYTIVISHTADSDTDAYDLTFSDFVPAQIENISVDSALITGSNDVSGSFEVDGQEVRTTLASTFDLALGDTLTLVISGSLEADTLTGIEIDNTATVQWTSLDGSVATERSGNSDANNDYVVSDNAVFTTATPTIVKQLLSTSENNALSEVAIGETATYIVTITLPEGQTNNTELVDVLDTGLAFVSLDSIQGSAGVSSSVDSFNNTGSFNPTVVGQTLSFDLQTLTNSNSDNATVETITLTYTVLVQNTNDNNAGVSLNNSAKLQWDNGTAQETALVDAADVTIIEPHLSTTKVVDDASPDLNQTITYTVMISNSLPASSADAFDVSFVDTLPAGLTLVADSVHIDGVQQVGEDLSFSIDKIDLGTDVVITYEVLVTSDIGAIGDEIDNDVDLTWSSLEADNSPNERGGDGVGPNDYLGGATAEADIVNPDLTVTKDSLAVSDVEPGDTFTYTIVATNKAGASSNATDVVVRDIIPGILNFNSANSTQGTVAVVAGEVVWTVGNLNIAQSETLTLTFTVDASVSAGVIDVTNTATINNENGHYIDPTPLDNTDSATDNVIAQPDYNITKTNNQDSVEPGENISYTIVVRNDGNQGGANIVVTDSFPTNELIFISADNGGIGNQGGGAIVWNIPSLGAGDIITLTANFEVSDTIAAGVETIDNLVDVTDDGANGPDPTPLDNMANDQDIINNRPDYTATITDNINQLLVGEGSTYVITITNEGTQNGTGVEVVNKFPLDFLNILGVSGGGIINTSNGTITWNVGDLAVGESKTFIVNAELKQDIDFSVREFSSTVRVSDDGLNGAEIFLSNNQDTDITSIIPPVGDMNILLDTTGIKLPDKFYIPYDKQTNQYHFHERIISLETIYAFANLMGGTAIVNYDIGFGDANEYWYGDLYRYNLLQNHAYEINGHDQHLWGELGLSDGEYLDLQLLINHMDQFYTLENYESHIEPMPLLNTDPQVPPPVSQFMDLSSQLKVARNNFDPNIANIIQIFEGITGEDKS